MLLKDNDMRVPPTMTGGFFGIQKPYTKINATKDFMQTLKNDTVSFSSTAKYLKQYVTMPEEIKKCLSAKDAVDMLKNMEYIADGKTKGDKIAQGRQVSIYHNPWLDDYYFMIADSCDDGTQIYYNRTNLGNLIWQNDKDKRIQLLKKSA